MGRIEKVIVLSVLLGVVLILAVSLDQGGSEAGVPDVPPAGGAELTARGMDKSLEGVGPRRPDIAKERGQGADPARGVEVPEDLQLPLDAGAPLAHGSEASEVESPETQPAQPNALLSSTIGEKPKATVKDGIPPGSPLITLDGLQRTSDDGLMSYRWKFGDSFAALAERFYGHVDYVTLLQRSNEGHTYFAEGDEILVPVYDLVLVSDDAENSGRTTAEPVAAAGQYVVREGDSLWTISKKTLGKGSRWQEIHALNMDKLPRADAVRVGMVLRIPQE
ncbi:MAG: LysM peptidoglycan-binding domain-containing protein [Planctomycetes bacterium]|nr:LysM peptidoglycan-binding domain-containing protein [Planctomycetota bacterium]